MIMLTDEIHAWGHIATIHYTHPPRSVVMQASLAGRVDFTTTGAFRGIVFFTSFIAGGVETDLMAPPIFGASQFRANDLSEVRGRLMADLCGARAVISQFNRVATMPTADSVDAAAESRMVAFHRPGNGTIAYKHIVKVFAGGRDSGRAGSDRHGAQQCDGLFPRRRSVGDEGYDQRRPRRAGATRRYRNG